VNTIFKGLSADLVTKLLTVPEFEGRVGLSLGGRGADPNLLKAPIPLAWPVMEGCKGIDPPSGKVPRRHMPSSIFKC